MHNEHKGGGDTAEADNHPGEAVRFDGGLFGEMVSKTDRSDGEKNDQRDKRNC